ncbi:unnamed protein product, partial [Adineta ricciae]
MKLWRDKAKQSSPAQLTHNIVPLDIQQVPT